MFTYGVYLVLATLWSSTNCLWVESNEPLYLTKYIDSNSTAEGRKAAEVKSFLEGIKSYSGLLTVDKGHGSNMFFWYFPAENNPETAPLIVWLNGYSTASTQGAFIQNGPYTFDKEELKRRDISWQKWFHVIYIDNPVGVGFSYTEKPEGYSKDLETIGTNLFRTLIQFYQIFPEVKDKDLYISGLSTAGKYVPALAYKIYKKNEISKEKLNLKGLFIGNPFLDPSQISYGEYLYEHGFVDLKEKLGLDQKEKSIQEALKAKDYESFYDQVKPYLIVKNMSYILNVTGLTTTYDYTGIEIDLRGYKRFIRKPDVKKTLHVGDLNYNNGTIAMNHFAESYAFSVKPWLEEMLNKVKMLFFNGQRDITWAYPMMTKVLDSLEWSGGDGYRSANRTKLYNGTSLSGYLRSYESLTDVLILEAGHVSLVYKPKFVIDLLFNLTGLKKP